MSGSAISFAISLLKMQLTQPLLPGFLFCVQLELSDPEQRWICQEILHLGVEEPGENMGECMYDGVDFTITATWLSDCPRKGLLQVYYNREARIIRKIRQQGAWDHDKSVRGAGQTAQRAGLGQVAFVCHCVRCCRCLTSEAHCLRPLSASTISFLPSPPTWLSPSAVPFSSIIPSPAFPSSSRVSSLSCFSSSPLCLKDLINLRMDNEYFGPISFRR